MAATFLNGNAFCSNTDPFPVSKSTTSTVPARRSVVYFFDKNEAPDPGTPVVTPTP